MAQTPSSTLAGSEHTATNSSCLVPSAGAPSCEAEANTGSSPASADISHHVGNPIDVVSGNKYQREIDYRSFDTGLTLVRHYNSSLADYNSGFGSGWRHTYQVFLTKSGDTGLNIVQSDGRLVEFSHVTGSESPKVYQAQSKNDGALSIVNNQATWFLPDGRQFTFNGSYLIVIDFGDHRGSLTLNYQKRRVHTVTDSRGGVLTFNYTNKRSSLPSYGEQQVFQPVGSIQSVNLPNGDLIEYRYADHNNLETASYADGDKVSYGYDDDNWPSHLTSRNASLEGRENTWEYDVNGLAVHWSEGADGNSVRIQRSQVDTQNQKHARVVYADGRAEHFQWITQDTQGNHSNQSIQLSCDNCAASNQPAQSGKPSIPAPRMSSTDSPTQQIWQTLSRSTHTIRQPGTDVFSSVVTDGENTANITVTANRLGEVSNLAVGETSLSQLASRLLRGQLAPCAATDSDQYSTPATSKRLIAIGINENPCSSDVLLLLDLVESLDAHAQGGASSPFDLSELQSRARRGATSEFFAGTLRYCKLPPGKTCTELKHDLDMANLSQCAYATGKCQTGFEVVDLNSLGMDPKRLDDKGFNAILYRDPVTNHYVLSFRGTDNVGDDWENNFNQAKGLYARQYDLAQRLGRDLNDLLKARGDTLSFTGHSLGGGLATIAALATTNQADIFNASAVQPTTAHMFGYQLAYDQATSYINHVHTRSDPLTFVQTVADDLDYSPGSYPEIQSVHGNNTQIPNPDIPWVNDVFAQNNATNPVQGLVPVIHHSIQAVIHTLENIISRNCP